MCKYCEHSGMNRPFYRNDEEENILISAWIVPKRAEIHIDYDYGMCGHTDVLDIKYCPFCGSEFVKPEKKYTVIADFIEPVNTMLPFESKSNLTFAEANELCEKWENDDIHTNVEMEEDDRW